MGKTLMDVLIYGEIDHGPTGLKKSNIIHVKISMNYDIAFSAFISTQLTKFVGF